MNSLILHRQELLTICMSPEPPNIHILPFAVDRVPRLICRLDGLPLLSYVALYGRRETKGGESQYPMRTDILVLGWMPCSSRVEGQGGSLLQKLGSEATVISWGLELTRGSSRGLLEGSQAGRHLQTSKSEWQGESVVGYHLKGRVLMRQPGSEALSFSLNFPTPPETPLAQCPMRTDFLVLGWMPCSYWVERQGGSLSLLL